MDQERGAESCLAAGLVLLQQDTENLKQKQACRNGQNLLASFGN